MEDCNKYDLRNIQRYDILPAGMRAIEKSCACDPEDGRVRLWEEKGVLKVMDDPYAFRSRLLIEAGLVGFLDFKEIKGLEGKGCYSAIPLTREIESE